MSDKARELLERLFDYVMVQEGGFKGRHTELANEVAAFLSGPGERLPAIIFAVVYYELGEHGVTWERCVDMWEKAWKPALTQEHFGDCINQPTACFRCQAEDCVRLAGLITEGLTRAVPAPNNGEEKDPIIRPIRSWRPRR